MGGQSPDPGCPKAPAFWSRGLPGELHVPEESLYMNLAHAAVRFPSKPALIFYGVTLTYGDLNAAAERMAAFLHSGCGVSPGDRVAIYSQNCPQFVIAYFAILRLGAVVVPLNAMLRTDELRHCVGDSGARVALIASELVGHASPLLASGELEHVVVHRLADSPTGARDDAPEFLRPGPLDLPDGAMAWTDAMACEKEAPPHAAGPSDLCLLGYTSGTTGAPKACMHTHRSMMKAAVASQLWRGNTTASVFLVTAPVFHLLGIQNGLNAPVYLGATVVMMARWDPELAARLIETHRVSAWSASPTMLHDVFSGQEAGTRDLSSLAVVTGGGTATPESVSRHLKERLGLDYVEGFGMTETAAFLFSNPMSRPKAGSFGLPTFGVDALIVDPDTLDEVENGRSGELLVAGEQVMQGYWNNPAANAASFVERHGRRYLRTGDVARRDEEGYYWMVDRLKRMINCAGYKVWPAEVEIALQAHPAVREACVFALSDARRGETVAAAVVRRGGEAPGGPVLDDEALIAWCRSRIAAYKVPRRVEFLDELPRTASGKLDWRGLRARYDRAGAS